MNSKRQPILTLTAGSGLHECILKVYKVRGEYQLLGNPTSPILALSAPAKMAHGETLELLFDDAASRPNLREMLPQLQRALAPFIVPGIQAKLRQTVANARHRHP